MFDLIKSVLSYPHLLITSKGYSWCIKGIIFIFKNNEYWNLFLRILIPQVLLTLFFYVIILIVLFPIQYTVSLLLTGPFGLVNIWVLVFTQSGLLSTLIVKTFIMPKVQMIAFDSVLVENLEDPKWYRENMNNPRDCAYILKIRSHFFKLKKKRSYVYILFKNILVFLLSFIPVIGSILITWIQTPMKGVNLKLKYFDLKRMTSKDIKNEYYSNTFKYFGFGLLANFFEGIPFISFFFIYSNTISAALWIVDEENEKLHSDSKTTSLVKKKID